MAHPFLLLFGGYAIYKFLGCCQKSLEVCSNSLENLTNDLDYQQQNCKRNLEINLTFDDDTLKEIDVAGGTVTKIDKEGENTVVHIDWKL